MPKEARMVAEADAVGTRDARSPSQETRILAIVAAAHWVSHLHIMVIPLLMPFLKERLGVGFLELGFALTVFAVVSGLTQAPMGSLVDRLGARRILMAGLCLGGAAFAAIGMVQSYPALIVCAAVAGLANSVYHPADYSLLSAHMDGKRMGRAFSVHTFAGFLGGAMAPVVILFLISKLEVAGALLIAGAIGPLVALLVATLPADRKLGTGAGEGKGASGSLRSVATPAILALMLFFVLLALSNGGIASFSVVASMQAYGVSFATANVALTAFLGLGALGVLAGGYLADRTDRHGQVAALAFTVNAGLIAIVAATPLPTVLFVGVLGLAGFLGGLIAPSRDMLVRKAAPPGAAGRAFGIVSTGFNIGGIVGPLLYGALMDHGLPRWVFAVSACFMLATVALAIATDRRRTRSTGPAAAGV
jgi:MFS family permease